MAAVYASSRYMDLRNNLCEELSRHDDMMMDLAEMGITLENCEQWSQRVVFAVIFVLFIVQLVRVSKSPPEFSYPLPGAVLTGFSLLLALPRLHDYVCLCADVPAYPPCAPP